MLLYALDIAAAAGGTSAALPPLLLLLGCERLAHGVAWSGPCCCQPVDPDSVPISTCDTALATTAVCSPNAGDRRR